MSREADERFRRLGPSRAQPRRRFRRVVGSTSLLRGRPAARGVAPRAVARLRYHWHRGGDGRLGAHLKYLARESATGAAHGEPKVFGNFPLGRLYNEVAKQPKHYRLMLAPEEYLQMDPGVYASEYMERLACRSGKQMKGQALVWAAYAHLNTTSPHIHFVIAGVDSRGRDVFLRREVVAGLSRIGEDVQRTLIGDVRRDARIDEERRMARCLRPQNSQGLEAVDRTIRSLGNKTSYRALMDLTPAWHRLTLHIRLVTLKRSGVLEIKDGLIIKAADCDDRWRQTRAVVEYLARRRVVKLCNPDQMVVASARTGNHLGIVTGIYAALIPSERIAMMETVNGVPVAVTLRGKRQEWEARSSSVSLMELRGDRLEPYLGSTHERLKKLRARSRVMDYLRATLPLDEVRAEISIQEVTRRDAATNSPYHTTIGR